MDNNKVLNVQIKSLLADADIVSELYEAGLAPEDVELELLQRIPEIWRAVAHDAQRVISAEQDLTSVKAHALEAVPYRRFNRIPINLALGVALTFASSAVIFLLGQLLFQPSWVPTSAEVRQLTTLAATLFVVPILIAGLVKLVQRRTQFRIEWEGGIIEKENAVRVAEQRLEISLREEGLLPVLRTIINEALDVSYSTKLRIRRADGLSEVFDPSYEVSTPETARLAQVMAELRGGSIGIAGHRGTGKTTLIRSFCTRGATNPLGDTAIALSLSVPVEYDPRDFLLHLFSEVCLRITGPPVATGSGDDGAPGLSRALRQHSFRRSVAMVSGVILSMIGIATGTDLFGLRSGQRLAIVTGGAGVCLLAVAVLYSRAIQRRHDSDVLRADPNFRPVDGLSGGEISALHRLQVEGIRKLREIRFQQSFTSGWSGSLRAGSLEAGLSGTHMWQRHPLTYPELVHQVREYLGAVAATLRPVVIGIDELDKIESPKIAKGFLNDLKGVFGVPKCFFLVSVSMDAIASFERRGLPLRDEFDSTFDEIIEVRNLEFQASAALLRRRVIGLTIPYIALAHCISGGLARDLIRAARHMIGYARASGSNLVGLVARGVLSADLAGKIDAAITSAATVSRARQLRELELVARRLEKDLPTDNLLAAAVSLRLGAKEERLWSDLITFCYFVATVIDVFDGRLSQERLKKAEADGGLDLLAGSRQAFARSPHYAWEEISQARRYWSLGEQTPPFHEVRGEPVGGGSDLTVESVETMS